MAPVSPTDGRAKTNFAFGRDRIAGQRRGEGLKKSTALEVILLRGLGHQAAPPSVGGCIANCVRVGFKEVEGDTFVRRERRGIGDLPADAACTAKHWPEYLGPRPADVGKPGGLTADRGLKLPKWY